MVRCELHSISIYNNKNLETIFYFDDKIKVPSLLCLNKKNNSYMTKTGLLKTVGYTFSAHPDYTPGDNNIHIIGVADSTDDEINIGNKLVGGYGGSIYHLITLRKYRDIENASWMIRLKNNQIFINNEFDHKLYLNSQDYTLTRLKSPVYMYEYEDKIYIACYGDGTAGAGAGAGVAVVTRNNISDITEVEVTSSSGYNNIHMINIFKPTDDKPFLIAVNLSGRKLYNIDPNNINFKTILYEYEVNTKPRHFIQIPYTNKIVVLTEQLNVELTLLEYNVPLSARGKAKFEKIKSYDLTSLAKNITGAEIMYYKGFIYITLRTYDKPYPTGELKPGIFAKFKLKNNKFECHGKLTVGTNPRYFNIDNSNIAYICNQADKTVTSVDIDTMKIKSIYNINNSCAFILLPSSKVIDRYPLN